MKVAITTRYYSDIYLARCPELGVKTSCTMDAELAATHCARKASAKSELRPTPPADPKWRDEITVTNISTGLYTAEWPNEK